MAGNFDVYLSNSPYINTVYIDDDVSNNSCSILFMDFDEVRDGEVTCVPKQDCDLLCYETDYVIQTNRTKRSIEKSTNVENALGDVSKNDSRVTKVNETVEKKSDNFYMTVTFWAFVILMCVGTVAFNVANCIGDAVCFDVLGKLDYSPSSCPYSFYLVKFYPGLGLAASNISLHFVRLFVNRVT